MNRDKLKETKKSIKEQTEKAVASMNYSDLTKESISICEDYMAHYPNSWKDKLKDNVRYKLITKRIKSLKR